MTSERRGQAMTRGEVQDYLGISRQASYDLANRDHSSFDEMFPLCVKIGRSARFDRGEIEAYWAHLLECRGRK